MHILQEGACAPRVAASTVGHSAAMGVPPTKPGCDPQPNMLHSGFIYLILGQSRDCRVAPGDDGSPLGAPTFKGWHFKVCTVVLKVGACPAGRCLCPPRGCKPRGAFCNCRRVSPQATKPGCDPRPNTLHSVLSTRGDLGTVELVVVGAPPLLRAGTLTCAQRCLKWVPCVDACPVGRCWCPSGGTGGTRQRRVNPHRAWMRP